MLEEGQELLSPKRLKTYNIFASQKRSVESPEGLKTADDEAPSNQSLSKKPRFQSSSSNSALHAETQEDFLDQQLLQPAVPPQETKRYHSLFREVFLASRKPKLRDLLAELHSRRAEFPKPLTNDLFHSIPVWLEWKRAAKPTKKSVAELKKAASLFAVSLTENKKKRTLLAIALDLEKVLVHETSELFSGSAEKHAHWHLLAKSAKWVQERCKQPPTNPEEETLMNVLAGIQSWLEMPRLSWNSFREQRYSPQRKAIKAELGALFVKAPNGVALPLSLAEAP